MINAYAYYLTTCLTGLLVFSCTGPPNLLNKSPLQSSIAHFRFATEETIIDTGAHKIRIRANEILKYSRRVRFVVSGTAFAPRDYAFATKPFVLHTPNYPNHHVKNIIEMPAGTNQIDISLTVKKQLRCEIKTIQLSIENLDGNMETLQLSLKHIPPPCVITIAGDGTSGSNNGLGTLTQFHQPRGIVTNRLGEIYVSDGSHIIRKIKSDGVTTTIAGTPGTSAYSNHGAGSFHYPTGLVFDTSNNLYVADRDNHRIRKITPGGVVSTLAGGDAGRVTATECGTTTLITPATTSGETCKDGTGTDARFNNPTGVAVGSAGVVYVADSQNHRIRKITPGGVVSTLAGGDAGGVTATECGTTTLITPATSGETCKDGTGTDARFNSPYGIAVDSAGVIYVADRDNHRIRKITVSGTTSVVGTLAGTGAIGDMDGAGNIAQFNRPIGVAVDSAGVIYVTDSSNHRIRKITPGGVVSTLAGTGADGFMDGMGNIAQFNQPVSVAVDSAGVVYVTDHGNHRIRKITTKIPTIDPICTNGVVSTAKLFTANTEKCISCNSGFSLDGELCRKEFDPICTNGVASIAKVFTANTEKCISCNSDYALKNDETCAEIVSVEILAGTGTIGSMDGVGTLAQFHYPTGVAVDSVGNVYVVDTQNHRIRKITVSGTTSEVSTLAGTGAYGFMDDTNGMASSAQFNEPSGVAVDSAGNVYVADYSNHRIRKITVSGTTSEVSTLAGTGTMGDVDGAGNIAKFNNPYGVAIDSDDNVYVADYSNHRIRKITSMGVVSTLAGTGTMGDVDGAGNIAKFNSPTSVAVDSDGNVYVTDSENHRIRKVTPMGVVSTLAGTGAIGFMDGAGNIARFNQPTGVAVDNAGNIYVADYSNYRIRKITSMGVVSTLAGTGIVGTSPCPGTSVICRGDSARFNQPAGVAVDNAGNIYVADQSGHRIRKITIPQ